MRRFFLVHGMKRSGNHAVIGWLVAQDRFLFCSKPIRNAPILRGIRPMPPPREFSDWLRTEGAEMDAADDRCVCANLEDFRLDVRPFRELPAGTTHVLLVRDPANLFASRIRKGREEAHPAYPREPGPMLTANVECWKAHAREYLGLTSLLANTVPVYFNAWFADAEYRRRLSARLGLEFSDAGYTQVSPAGGGSSFDGTAFDGDNARMNVLDRAAQLDEAEAQMLAGILDDAEVRDLGRRIEATFVASGERQRT